MMKARLKRIFRGACSAALLVAAWGACASSAAAKPSTVVEYRQRVEEAEVSLESLARLCDGLAAAGGERDVLESDGEGGDSLPFPEAQKQTLGEVRRLVPAKEQVEWGGGSTVEADNVWLHWELGAYELESSKPATSYRMRAARLREIAERLHAVETRLIETERAVAAQGQRDKDAEKGRLENILSRPEYNKEVAEGGALQRLVEQFVQWLRDLFPDVAPVRPGATRGVSRVAQFLVLALCLAVIAFVARKYWQRRARNVKLTFEREPRVVLGEQLAPDETAADLLSDADRLARTGDLRGAIRKAYVALLCELGDRRVIRLAQHKTNRDYLQAIRASASPRLYTEMLPLTFNFELHWYGLQDAAESDWKEFHQRCRQVLKSI